MKMTSLAIVESRVESRLIESFNASLDVLRTEFKDSLASLETLYRFDYLKYRDLEQCYESYKEDVKTSLNSLQFQDTCNFKTLSFTGLFLGVPINAFEIKLPQYNIY